MERRAAAWSRREALGGLAGLLAAGLAPGLAGGAGAPGWEIARFAADVTPPIGHPLIGGSWLPPAERIEDPLSARGLVFLGPAERPLVLVALDWCELRNAAYDRWRDVLAEAAGTDRERVLVHCVHQHDAPYVDLEAQRLLDGVGLQGLMFDPAFFEDALQRTAAALRASLGDRRRVTHVGLGRAEVQQIASNRRVVLPDGTVAYHRGSTTRDPAVRDAPAGEIDPWLRTLSFWDGRRPVAAISLYAVHPMSYYGRGGVTPDFVGLARQRQQEAHPDVFQVFLTGCSGDVTGGKYNDPDRPHASRQAFTERLHRAMARAWRATERVRLDRIGFRVAPLHLEARRDGPFAVAAMQARLEDASRSKGERIQAALGLSWHRRVAAGRPIDVPALDFGAARLLLLPAEAFVGYGLAASALRPDAMVLAAGFGECAPGYLPTEATWDGFVAEHDSYCWAAPSAPERILAALRTVLGG